MAYVRTQYHRDLARANKTGEKNHNYGKPIPEDVKEKIRNSLRGRTFTPEWRKKISDNLKGKYRNSPAQQEALRILHENNKGEKSVKWKGGVNPLMDSIRKHSKSWAWRGQIYARDNYTCQKTGEKGKKLNAHHIKPVHQIIKEYNITNLEQAMQCQELWDINNGITLSRASHKEFHRIYGIKVNREQLDKFFGNDK